MHAQHSSSAPGRKPSPASPHNDPLVDGITPALRGRDADPPLILDRDCTNCGRCIDVCSVDVFSFTHRFDTAPAPGRPDRKSKSEAKAAA